MSIRRMIGAWCYFDEAWEMMSRVRLVPPVDRGDLYAEFISFIAHLQVASGEQPMVLPVGITGAELGLLPRTVSILIGWAIEDGLLTLVEAHNFTQHRARSFRFALEKYPGIGGDHVNLEDEITIRLEGDQMVVAVDYSIPPVPRFIRYAGPPVNESTGAPVVDAVRQRVRTSMVSKSTARRAKAKTGGPA
ncbi:MAG: hypothetical protein WCE63_23260 [Acidobacteriaceae bacterium]